MGSVDRICCRRYCGVCVAPSRFRQGFAADAVLFVLVSASSGMAVRSSSSLVPAHIKRARRAVLLPIANSPHASLQARSGGAGCLLFVSLGERYAELIADREAHARVGQEAWDRIFAGFTAAGAKQPCRRRSRGAIEACGAALASHPAGLAHRSHLRFGPAVTMLAALQSRARGRRLPGDRLHETHRSARGCGPSLHRRFVRHGNRASAQPQWGREWRCRPSTRTSNRTICGTC